MARGETLVLVGVFMTVFLCANGCQYCGCYGTPNCDCYCPPWMYIGYDKIMLNPAQGQVSVSSSAAASVKYNKGAPQAYISSLSSAKADPNVSVNIIGGPKTPPPVVTTVVPPKSSPLPPTGAPPTQPGGTKQAWDYKPSDQAYGPGNWKLLTPRCGGLRQSPVDITTANALPKAVVLKLVSGHPDPAIQGNLIVKGKLKNNGRALGFTVDSTATPVKLNFKNPYTLKQFHFHIGCEDQMGSEHSLDGQRFPGEIHFIFTNDKYPDVKNAMQAPDGLIGIAFFMQYDETAENKALKRITENMNILRMPHGIVDFPDGISLTNLVPAFKEGLANLKVFAYQGSLPTPPCFESVTWFVFRRPVKVNGVTLENWRNHLQGDFGRMCGNYRPIQKLNGRKIITLSAPLVQPTGAPPSGPTPSGAAPPVSPTVANAPSGSPATSTAPSAPVAGARAPAVSLEKAGAGFQEKAFAKLVGNPSKLVDEKHAPADARQELQPAQMVGPGNANSESNVKPQTADNPMLNLAKISSGMDSKLIPESKKGIDNTVPQALKITDNGLTKKDENQRTKPSVAPGMKRQGI